MATFKRKNENGNLIYSRWWLGATLEKNRKGGFPTPNIQLDDYDY